MLRVWLAAADDFATNVACLSATVEGKLKVGLVDYFVSDPNNPISRIFKLLQSSTPNVVLDVTIGSARELERQVLEDKLILRSPPNTGSTMNSSMSNSTGKRSFAGQHHEVARRLSSGETLTRAAIQKYPLVYRSMPEPPTLQRLKSAFPEGTRIQSTEVILNMLFDDIATL